MESACISGPDSVNWPGVGNGGKVTFDFLIWFYFPLFLFVLERDDWIKMSRVQSSTIRLTQRQLSQWTKSIEPTWKQFELFRNRP